MSWLLVGVALVLVVFAFAIMTGAPFLPTLRRQMPEAFEMLGLKPGQTLLELGSGDGRMLREAAKHGVHSIGYEINPLLVLYSKLRCWSHRRLITIHWGNFWHIPLPPADGIYVFLTAPYMQKLDKKITQEYSKPVKVVSFAFQFAGRSVARDKNGLYLYYF